MREHADRARNLADADDVPRAGRGRDRAAAPRMPERQLHAERHRLRVNAVGAADHRRPPVLLGARPHRLQQLGEVLDDQIAGLAHLQRLRGVEDVRGGQAEVQPAGGGSDVLGDRGEGDDVVLGDLLDGFDAGNVELRPGPELCGGRRGNDAGLGHRIRRGQLDFQPGFVAALIAPDRAHCRIGMHRGIMPPARGRFEPDQLSRDAPAAAPAPTVPPRSPPAIRSRTDRRPRAGCRRC